MRGGGLGEGGRVRDDGSCSGSRGTGGGGLVGMLMLRLRLANAGSSWGLGNAK